MKPKLQSSKGKRFLVGRKITFDDIFKIGRNAYLIMLAVAFAEVLVR